MAIKRNTWWRRLYTLIRQPLSKQILVIKVLCLLGVTRLAINLLPFHRLERYLGTRMHESGQHITEREFQYARRVRWAINAISPYTPWKSNCFPQALTAKILLRNRGINSTLYLGAAFKNRNKQELQGSGENVGPALQGHAWLRCGPYFLTGGDSASQFGAIASFAD